MIDTGSANATVAAKVSKVVADGLAALADERGMIQSSLLRLIAEMTLDGRLELPSDDELVQRRRNITRARLREDLRRQIKHQKANPPEPRRFDVMEMHRMNLERRAAARGIRPAGSRPES